MPVQRKSNQRGLKRGIPRPALREREPSLASGDLRDQAPPLFAPQHLLHRSRSVGPAAAREMTLRGERLRYLPKRLALPM
jgi:hypothetical protein